MNAHQRQQVLRQVLANPAFRAAIFGGLQERRGVAIENLVKHTDAVSMHRAQGQVHEIDSIIEEYKQCLV